ncbi:Crp/Fnr family transcriptional regulator [filamentous cyanobacterium LEGE 11480]|uniref:Crp/Fnr family transcriptional regulator n=1 Tax=Romeriopsis navalis LEGE 11480 TaxID=2777977 RepID=A0A928Z4Y4_9CYAN|nr:Crp/Fnr family transcriptional regulator [Romeriopsis navalis]MBE9030680.1 Crp/Fnr family transcriptional regulator [Romeriopsis navalis LEGE 11480]
MLKLLPSQTVTNQDPQPEVAVTVTQPRRIHPWKPKTYRFNRGDQLPDYGDLLWQITDGYVRNITWTKDGEMTTLGIWGEYDFLGHALSIVTPYCLECITPVTAVLCAYPINRMHEILLHNAQQTEKLLAISHERQVYERLRSLLTWLARRFGESAPAGRMLKIGLTHQQLADLAGTTRVTVTRFMQQLERDGWIKRLPKRQILVYPTS